MQPNILFVFADQLRSMELGCYGGDQVRTPHMDRLAREGALFTHAFSTYPVCSPFRAMLMTGNFPMTNGMVMNDHFLRNPEETPFIPAWNRVINAIPDILEQLAEAVEADTREYREAPEQGGAA